LQQPTEVGDKNRIALIYINRGSLYNTISKYELALADLKKAVQLSEETQNDDRLSRASSSLAQLYIIQENWKDALPWAEKALQIQMRLGNEQQDGRLPDQRRRCLL
jgi:tetratricopeptide (TPR) repeat protein